MKCKLIPLLTFLSSVLFSQVTDFRDPFLGLFHTIHPPCNNGQDQNFPNHYVLIEKDTNSIDSIFVTDTLGLADGIPSNPSCHLTILQQSDSTYNVGWALGKFLSPDSLRIFLFSIVCGGSGSIYYLHKIAPVGISNHNTLKTEWYLFPNPVSNLLNIVIPNYKTELTISLYNVTGKCCIKTVFFKQGNLDVSQLPKGLYNVKINGEDFNVAKRILIVDE